MSRWHGAAGAFVTTAAGLVCVVVGLALLGYAGLPARNASVDRLAVDPGAPVPGAAAPLFSVPLRDGRTLRLEDLRGSPVILNFWATWCAPCEIEMPELQALADTYEPRGLRVIAINVQESRDTVSAWAERLQLRLSIALDERGAVADLYAVSGQPTTFVIDADGIVRDVIYGMATRQQLEALIVPHLAPQAL